MPVRRTRLLVPALTLALAGLTAVVSPAWAAESCAGETATVVGTPGDDVLRGTPARDVIAGLGGADVVSGLEGADLVCGGPGDDEIRAGAGADTLVWNPGDGSDAVTGGAGTDQLDFNGSAAAETIELGADGDVAVVVRDIGAVRLDLVGVEDVEVRALGGGDALSSSDLSGTAVGDVTFDLAGAVPGVGDDAEDAVRFLATDDPDIVIAGPDGSGLAWSMPTGTAYRMVNGQSLAQSASPDYLTLDLGGGEDDLVVTGTGGDDQVAVSSAGAEVLLKVGSAPDLRATAERTAVQPGAGDDDVEVVGSLAGVTRLTLDGGGGADVLLGGNGDDTLIGGAGPDRLRGRQGTDRVVLGDGADLAEWFPGDGSDEVLGGDGTDRLAFAGSNAAETIVLSRVPRSGPDDVLLTRNVGAVEVLSRAVEAMEVHALGGVDALTTGNLRETALSRVAFLLALGGGGGDGAQDVLTVEGTPGRDEPVVSGDADTVTVAGLGPEVTADVLEPTDVVRVVGGSGTDRVTVRGTAGDDQMELYADGGGGSPAADLGLGGPPLTFPAVEHLVADLRGGDDVIDANSDADGVPSMTVLGGGGNDGLFGGPGPDRLVGGPGADTLAGNGGHDLLDGGTGADDLAGGDGIDTVDYRRAPKAVAVDLTAGTATGFGGDLLDLVEAVLGSTRGDRLRGSSGPDRLVGGGGDDRLLGLAGDDVLVGGGGRDSCAGGTGTDTARKCERTTGVPRLLQSWTW